MPLPAGKPRRKDVVSRSKSWIAIVAIIIVATALAAVALPQKAEAASLKGKLHHAKLALQPLAAPPERCRGRLRRRGRGHRAHRCGSARHRPHCRPHRHSVPDRRAHAATTPAPAGPTVEELKAAVARARHAVRRSGSSACTSLASAVSPAASRWPRGSASGKWMPIMRIAAARYHVERPRHVPHDDARVRRAAGAPGRAAPYKGLFQYHTGTWAASWNPWRHDSIYDGSSQVFATALAIHRGMGASMWTTTYWSQY